MPHTRLELSPDLWLDARRAVFLADTGTLAVADLHLGYAWAHRHAGQLLPLSAGDDAAARLIALIDDYSPREVVLLGDIVHRAAPVPAIREEVRALCKSLSARAELHLLAGNHDARLSALAGCELQAEWNAGRHLMLHGDCTDDAAAVARLEQVREGGGRVIFGHEHPAIALTAGVASRVKCPCFLSGEDALVLPAFSPWAAGTDVNHRTFLSAFARQARFTQAIAIVAGKLLPISLPTAYPPQAPTPASAGRGQQPNRAVTGAPRIPRVD